MSSVQVDGEQIRRLREERCLDRKELAEFVGISMHRLYMIEQRGANTRYTVLRKLAKVLGVTPESLQREIASV